MKTSTPSYRGTRDLVLDLIGRTHVESAYDSRGNLSYFVATLPRPEFYCLYTQGSFALVFLDGHWLQFHELRGEMLVTNRHTGATLEVHLKREEWGTLVINLTLGNRKVTSLRTTRLGCENPFDTAKGLNTLARLAQRGFDKLGAQPIGDCDVPTNLPCVIVVPEREELAEFNRDSVNLQ